MRIRFVLFAGLAFLLAALPAAALDSVIQRGIDPWTTIPEATFSNFYNNPLPAGFFCADFSGFSGQGGKATTELCMDTADGETGGGHGPCLP